MTIENTITFSLLILVAFLLIKSLELKQKLEVSIALNESYKTLCSSLGICTQCFQIPEMDEEGPYSYCACGTREDHGFAKLQQLGLIKRKLNIETVRKGAIVYKEAE